jgi:hypothetical protein
MGEELQGVWAKLEVFSFFFCHCCLHLRKGVVWVMANQYYIRRRLLYMTVLCLAQKKFFVVAVAIPNF